MAKLLLVADSPAQGLWLEANLAALGHSLRRCASVDIAKAEHAAEDFDLALVALLLEAGNGFELGVRLHAQGHKRVALISNRPRATDVQWARAIGLLGAVDIPVPLARLAEQLSPLLAWGCDE